MNGNRRITTLKTLAAMVFFLALAGATGACAQDDDGAAAVPNLSGIWILDENESDDPEALVATMRENMKAARGGSGRGGGPGGGGMRGGGGGMRGGGGGMRGGGGTGGGPGGGSAGPNGGMVPGGENGPLCEGRTQLLITQVDGTLEIIDARENTRKWECDGQTAKHKTDRGEMTETATWKDGNLVIQSKVGEHPGMIQWLSLSEDGKHLYRTVQLGMPTAGEKVTIALVYDLAE